MAEARITSRLDSRGFEKGVGKMKGGISKLSASLGSMKGLMAGAFSIGAITSLFKGATEFGSSISDLADQAGISTDAFQALEIAAMNAGVEQEKIRTAMSKLNVVMGQAKGGMKTYVDMFRKVGIAQKELENMNPQQVFERLAGTISTAERGSEAFGAALEILGTRSGAQLVEVFRKINNEGLDQMITKGKQAGQIMGGDLVKALDETADAMAQFDRGVKVVSGRTIGFFSKMFKSIATFQAARKLGISGLELGQRRLDAESALKKAVEEKAAAANKKLAEQSAIEAAKMVEDIADKALDKSIKAKKEKQDKANKENAESEIKWFGTVAEARKGLAKIDGGTVSGPGADRLGAIGGSLGGAVSPALMLARQNLQLDQKRNDYLKNLPPRVAEAVQGLGTYEV